MRLPFTRHPFTFTLALALALARVLAACGAARADEPEKPPVTVLPAAAQMPPNVTLVEARMTRRALHDYDSTTGVRLPRIQIYGADTAQRLHAVGWDEDVAERVHTVLAGTAWKPQGKSFEHLFRDIERAVTGEPIDHASLPPADFYVVTSWAGWCRPCGTAMVELRKSMEADPSRRYVWITVETDVIKQKIQKQSIR